MEAIVLALQMEVAVAVAVHPRLEDLAIQMKPVTAVQVQQTQLPVPRFTTQAAALVALVMAMHLVPAVLAAAAVGHLLSDKLAPLIQAAAVLVDIMAIKCLALRMFRTLAAMAVLVS
jgi:hypothetical protein